MRKIQPGNAVWEEWRLATEPTIEPDPDSLHDVRRSRRQFFGASGLAPLGALRLAFPDLLGEEVEGQRARRLVRIDVLTVHLAALDEERSLAPEQGPPAQRNRDVLRDDVALERLHGRSVHHRSPYPGLLRTGRETGVVSTASEDVKDGRTHSAPPVASAQEVLSIQDQGNVGGHFAAIDDSITLG